jgi:CheY-like chemotaxis protein
MTFLKQTSNIDIILIVDDEKINLKSLKSVLTKFYIDKGHLNTKFISLNDGIDALNLLYFDTLFYMKISMVFSDLNMKFMNGDLLFKVISQINRNALQRVKFVMYTNTEKKIVMENVKGVKYFLKKPCAKIDLDRLYSSINNE